MRIAICDDEKEIRALLAEKTAKLYPKAGSNGTGLSQASMTAVISADSSMKLAKAQGSVATKMEGSQFTDFQKN